MTNAEMLMRKGKRGAAALIQAECVSSANPSHLNALLDHLLAPDKDLDDGEAMDWCRWLVGGGETYEDFSHRVKKFDVTEKCGLVWTADFVAFRCRTCGISQCMSLCADCFQEGNHEGHDFNMFKSQAGGACDCGDSSVMRPSGFCRKHRAAPSLHDDDPSSSSMTSPPDELLIVASNMIPRIILRLVQHLRVNIIPSSSSKLYSPSEALAKYEKTIEDAEGLLVLLHDFSSLGAAMRGLMTNCLIDKKIYVGLTRINVDSQYANFMQKSQSLYKDALEDLPNNLSLHHIPMEHRDYIIDEKLQHSTFLEELVFWTVKYEFPELLNCLLLKMLPDATYREAFTRSFVMHYSRVSLTLSQSSNSDRLSNRVVHVSVQLFSNEKLALSMAENYQLLHVMVSSLVYNMMSKVLIKCTLHSSSPRSSHMVIDCKNHITKDHCYWPLVSDLSNVLSHQPIALKFMSDNGLLSMWFSFLQMLQGMNVNERELEAHIGFEPSTYYASFSAELEASASPMWALLSHLKDRKTGQYTANVINHCVVALLEWFKVNNFTSPNECDVFKVSFHIPLHRYFSMFVRQGVICHGFSLKELLPEPQVLWLIMAHPLRVQTAFYEIMCGIWVRNGLQIKGQAMTYLQCHFCKSMVDADIFLLQICATQLPPLHFLSTVLERFQMDDWLTFSTSGYKVNRMKMDKDQVVPMLESCLTFLVSLLILRTNLGLSETDLARLEMVTLLCMGDKQHSKLFDSIPEGLADPIQIELFDSVLMEVGQYREPQFEAGGNMQQGIYLPKPEVWENLYDPIYVLLRAVHRKDFQASIDRFTEYAKNKYANEQERLKTITNLWPPWRLPSPCHNGFDDPRRILHSRFSHGLIFNILFKAVHDEDAMVSEHIISLTIFLLELALTYPRGEFSGKEIAVGKPWLIVHKPTDLKYDTWFPTDWLSANLRHVVSAVFIPPFLDIIPSTRVEVDNVEAAPTSSSSSSSPPGPDDSLSNSPFIMPKHSLTYNNTSSILEDDKVQQRQVVLSSGDTKDDETQPCPPPYSIESSSTSININESIITLLLKLHSKLSKHQNSYTPLFERTGMSTSESYRNSRIGNGVFFIEKVLDLIVEMDDMCKQAVSASRSRIWPSASSYSSSSSFSCHDNCQDKMVDGVAKEQNLQQNHERREAELKRKRAKLRQKQMMEQLAAQQRAFMANVGHDEELATTTATTSTPETSPPIPRLVPDGDNDTTQQYDCVHCHLTTPSTEDKPIGLVVLLQATSVLSHVTTLNPTQYHSLLPTSDAEGSPRGNTLLLGPEYAEQFDELSRVFDDAGAELAVNKGWEGGIHIQSCGHLVHLSCRQSYLEHLKSQQRTENNQILDVEHGEYMCPMCRQLANSILPIPPHHYHRHGDEGGNSSFATNSPNTTILTLLQNHSSRPVSTTHMNKSSSPLQRSMTQLMQEFLKTTPSKYQPDSSKSSRISVFAFVSSIARINLELDLVQRGGNLIGGGRPFDSSSSSSSSSMIVGGGVNSFKTCFVPLLHVLSNHAKMNCPVDLCYEWSEMTSSSVVDGLRKTTKKNNFVPLLLQDCSTLFLHFILLLPIPLDVALFEALINALYNLRIIQSLAKISCAITDKERDAILKQEEEEEGSSSSLHNLLRVIIQSLEKCSLYRKLNTFRTTDVRRNIVNKLDNNDDDCLESQVQRHVLPLLRIASLFRHYLYTEPLPEICGNYKDEFSSLASFLKLNLGSSQQIPSQTVVRSWCNDFIESATPLTTLCKLLTTNVLWNGMPQLLRLPKNYDAIFQFYHKKECGVCQQVPKDPSICLLCGVLVCFRESCCRFGGGGSNTGICEAIRHSVDCGAGTAMFLAVNSSYIVVVRGRRACVWGSIYLDSFGEEDKELKRGRPLFLNEERYNLLQQQWINHRFSHNNRTWIWHWNQL